MQSCHSKLQIIIGMLIGAASTTSSSCARSVLAQSSVDSSVKQLNTQIKQLYQQGRYKDALPLAERLLEQRKLQFGNDHPSVATSINNLALLYKNQGRYEKAKTLYLKALELRKKVFGNDHPSVGTSYWNLGVLYERQGQYQKAKSLYLPALDIFQKRLETNHPNTQNILKYINALPEGTEALPLKDLEL